MSFLITTGSNRNSAVTTITLAGIRQQMKLFLWSLIYCMEMQMAIYQQRIDKFMSRFGSCPITAFDIIIRDRAEKVIKYTQLHPWFGFASSKSILVVCIYIGCSYAGSIRYFISIYFTIVKAIYVIMCLMINFIC